MVTAVHSDTKLPLIPRKVLFGDPDKATIYLSPDGTKISFLAPVEGVLNIWVCFADKPETAKPVTHDAKRGIHNYLWAYTNRHIIYQQDKDGDENWHVYSIDIESETVCDLTPIKGVQARIQAVSHLFPYEVLIGLNNRMRQFHDIYRAHLSTGKLHLLFRNEEYAGVITDDHFDVRLGCIFSPAGGMSMTKLSSQGEAKSLLDIEAEDVFTTTPIDFDASGQQLYMLDSRGRNTAALTRLDLDTLASVVVATDAQVDVEGVLLHPTDKTLQAYSTYYERRHWHPLDAAVAKDIERLRSVGCDDFTVMSRTLDDRIWIVAYESDISPVKYYRYDRTTGNLEYLFTNRSELETFPLARMRPITISARDGLRLLLYLTLPMEADSKGQPTTPLPLVLWVHGGPWFRDTWGLKPVHQWLANRGYAVMSINYRGSTGFGKSFINAANHEWGGKMHDDLIDAVDWAIRNKIACPGRVALMGGSYGGYATLVGMTNTPDTFACGIDLVGPSNLITFLNNAPEYWIPIMPLLKDRVGDPTTEVGRAFLKQRSPLTHVSKVKRPLLIGQGANDPRVPQQESDQIVHALQERGIPVTYLVYPDEGHGFVRPPNDISFWAVAEAFLACYLGGRYQPIDDDLVNSTIQVVAGGEGVPGLTEAISELQRDLGGHQKGMQPDHSHRG